MNTTREKKPGLSNKSAVKPHEPFKIVVPTDPARGALLADAAQALKACAAGVVELLRKVDVDGPSVTIQNCEITAVGGTPAFEIGRAVK